MKNLGKLLPLVALSACAMTASAWANVDVPPLDVPQLDLTIQTEVVDGYTYEGGVLTFTAGGEYTISNAEGVESTADTIEIDTDGNAVTLILDGVIIDTDENIALVAQDALTLTLADDSVNIIATSAKDAAPVNKGSKAIFSSESLTINGNGHLFAYAGEAESVSQAVVVLNTLSLEDAASVTAIASAVRPAGDSMSVGVVALHLSMSADSRLLSTSVPAQQPTPPTDDGMYTAITQDDTPNGDDLDDSNPADNDFPAWHYNSGAIFFGAANWDDALHFYGENPERDGLFDQLLDDLITVELFDLYTFAIAEDDDNHIVQSLLIAAEADKLPTDDDDDDDDDKNDNDKNTSVRNEKDSYEISISKASNGSVSVNRDDATQNQLVRITAKPNSGYVVDTVIVTDEKGKEVAVTLMSDGTYAFRQPSSEVSISVTFTKDTSAPAEPEYIPMTFNDVSRTSWYVSAVDYVSARGWMQGTSEAIFQPNATLTRAMVAQIMYNLEADGAKASRTYFDDVNDAMWYANAINWCAQNELVHGMGNGTFVPEGEITTEEFAQILMNYAQTKGYKVDTTYNVGSLGDSPSNWAAEAMSWAANINLLDNMGGSKMYAQLPMIRAHVATMLMNFDMYDHD